MERRVTLKGTTFRMYSKMEVVVGPVTIYILTAPKTTLNRLLFSTIIRVHCIVTRHHGPLQHATTAVRTFKPCWWSSSYCTLPRNMRIVFTSNTYPNVANLVSQCGTRYKRIPFWWSPSSFALSRKTRIAYTLRAYSNVKCLAGHRGTIYKSMAKPA